MDKARRKQGFVSFAGIFSALILSIILAPISSMQSSAQPKSQQVVPKKSTKQPSGNAPSRLPSPSNSSNSGGGNAGGTGSLWSLEMLTGRDSVRDAARQIIEALAKMPKEDHKARAEALFTLLRLEQYQTVINNFDTTVISMRTPQLEAIWTKAKGILGQYINTMGVSSERQSVGDIVLIETLFLYSALDVRFTFSDKHKIVGFAFNQGRAKYENPPYASPNDIEEREITVKTDKYELPGILALPKNIGDKRVPVALLLHDQGTQDRDRSDNGYKPNRDLALGLGKAGIATLRYDKRIRLYQYKASEMEHYTVYDETIEDAASALALLRTLAQTLPIDSTKIVIVAPTLAAMVLPRILKADSARYKAPSSQRFQAVAGAVQMGVNFLPWQDLILPRYDRLNGKNAETVAGIKQRDDLKKRVEAVDNPRLSTKTPINELPYGIPSSYWLDLRRHNHVEEISNLALPMLFLFAEEDGDIDFKANGLAWKNHIDTKLKSRADSDAGVRWKSYPNLFHLFAEGNGTLRDYARKGNVDAAVIKDIAEWIGKR